MKRSEQFTSKANSYHNRWDYAPAAIDAICAAMQGCDGKRIADLGTGNGMLGKHLAARGADVFGVDVNDEMLAVARASLAESPLFHAVLASAEETTLPANYVDAVVIGRALHWFSADPTRQEIMRILKPNGLLAILRVQPADKAIGEALLSLRSAENGWDMRYGGRRPPLPPYEFFFGHAQYQTLHFSQVVDQDWEQFWGELCSRSSAPQLDNPDAARFRQAAQQLFAQLSQDDIFTIETTTTVSLGNVV